MRSLDKILQKNLSQILIDGNYIKSADLKDAELQSQQEGISLEEVLLQKELTTEDKLAETMALHMNIPYVSLNDYEVSEDFIKNSPFPPSLMLKFQLIPIDKIDNILTILVGTAPDRLMVDAITSRCEDMIFLCVGQISEIMGILRKCFPDQAKDKPSRMEAKSTVWHSIFDDADEKIRNDLRQKAKGQGIIVDDDMEQELDQSFLGALGEDDVEEAPAPDETISKEVDDIFGNLFGEDSVKIAKDELPSSVSNKASSYEEDYGDEDYGQATSDGFDDTPPNNSEYARLDEIEVLLQESRDDYNLLNEYVDLAISIDECQMAINQLLIFAKNLYNSGDREGAINCYGYILDLDPDNEEAQKYLRALQ